MSHSILIVEDDDLIRQMLVEKFSSAGFMVSRAFNGEEGLSLALSNHPDVVLLDIVLPKMDGFSVLNKLREDEWGKGALVYIVSSLKDSFDRKRAEKYDVVFYFIKEDWNPDDLVQNVKDRLMQRLSIPQ